MKFDNKQYFLVRCFWTGLLVFAFSLRLVMAFYWDSRISKNTEMAVETTTVVEHNKVEHNKVEYNKVEHKKDVNTVQDGPFFFGDSDSYWKLGRALAFGRPYQFDEERHWTYFRMPGYPALLAPLFRIYGENPPVMAARILGCLYGIMTVAMVGLLAFQLFRDHKIAWTASFLTAMEPCSVVQSVLILSEEPFTVVMLIQLWLFVLFYQSCSGPVTYAMVPFKTFQPQQEKPVIKTYSPFLLAVLIGLFSAWTVYFRPSWLYFPIMAFIVPIIFMAITAFIKRKQNKTEARNYSTIISSLFKYGISLVIVLFILAVCLTPWWIRNYRTSGGYFIPLTLQQGASLYDGLRPTANGSSNMDFIDTFRKKELEEPSADPARVPFELRLDQRLKKASLDWTFSNPDKVVSLIGIKFCRLWSIVPNEKTFSTPLIRWTMALYNGPIILLGLLGCLVLLRYHVSYCFLWLPALYITCLHVIFVSSIRYRTPAMYGLMIATAFIIWKYIRSCHRGS